MSIFLAGVGVSSFSIVEFTRVMLGLPKIHYTSVLTQWLWFLGHWIEHGVRLSKGCLPREVADNQSSSAAASAEVVRPTCDGSVLEDLDESTATVTRRLLSYYYASRRATAGCKTLGYAVDAGRVSKRGNFVGAFTTPNNLSFWAPPQVRPPRFLGPPAECSGVMCPAVFSK